MTVEGTRTARLALAIMALVAAGPSAEGQPRAGNGDERGPSNPTVLGDTGLWFVPSAEVPLSGQWSLSTFRVNIDRQQGFTDVSHFAGGASVGVGNRLELFGSLNARTRIDRDVRPLSNTDVPAAGGLDSDYPFVRDGFSQGRGDLSIGAKFNVLSESRGHPAAFAMRSVVKLPTGEKDKGVTTGEADVIVDAIVSKSLSGIELTGFGGAIARGDAPDANLPNGVRWGVGAGFPAPARIRVIAEVRGEVALGDGVVTPRPFVSSDGSLAPLRSLIRNPADALLGATWQAPNGVFVGAAMSWAARFSAPDSFGVSGASGIGDRVGFQMGLGFRPGRRAVVPRPAVPTPRASAAPVALADPVASRPELVNVADPAPAPVAFVFEDIHFDFDRATLRPAGLRVLDEAATALMTTPTFRLTIDGHTCNIGTSEYNLALADRRSQAVRDYLLGRGVDAARLTTIAYGEERPGYDNGREETRRLNRRAALVVELSATSEAQ